MCSHGAARAAYGARPHHSAPRVTAGPLAGPLFRTSRTLMSHACQDLAWSGTRVLLLAVAAAAVLHAMQARFCSQPDVCKLVMHSVNTVLARAVAEIEGGRGTREPSGATPAAGRHADGRLELDSHQPPPAAPSLAWRTMIFGAPAPRRRACAHSRRRCRAGCGAAPPASARAGAGACKEGVKDKVHCASQPWLHPPGPLSIHAVEGLMWVAAGCLMWVAAARGCCRHAAGGAART